MPSVVEAFCHAYAAERTETGPRRALHHRYSRTAYFGWLRYEPGAGLTAPSRPSGLGFPGGRAAGAGDWLPEIIVRAETMGAETGAAIRRERRSSTPLEYSNELSYVRAAFDEPELMTLLCQSVGVPGDAAPGTASAVADAYCRALASVATEAAADRAADLRPDVPAELREAPGRRREEATRDGRPGRARAGGVPQPGEIALRKPGIQPHRNQPRGSPGPSAGGQAPRG
jgi:hypothetical protein